MRAGAGLHMAGAFCPGACYRDRPGGYVWVIREAAARTCSDTKHLRSLLGLPRAAGPRAPKRAAAKQAQKRLAEDEVAQLVAEHRAGAGVKELAARFGVHRWT